MSPRAAGSRFAQALGRPGSQLQVSGVRLATFRKDARHALQLAGRLHGYRQYLAQARAFRGPVVHGVLRDMVKSAG